jgi:hypothetical protein
VVSARSTHGESPASAIFGVSPDETSGKRTGGRRTRHNNARHVGIDELDTIAARSGDAFVPIANEVGIANAHRLDHRVVTVPEGAPDTTHPIAQTRA